MTLAHLCLGTASWNQEAPYNNRVPPDDDEIRRILDVAEAGGIRWLDTAIAYGDAWKRLDAIEVWSRFKIVTKVQPGQIASIDVETALLSHLAPDDHYSHAHGRFSSATHFATLLGASVYTPEQATAALDAGVQVLQVPWNKGDRPALVLDGAIVDGWEHVRDRAYADGVLFFGRQPFARGALAPPWTYAREAFAWALTTNPRGWCVVGVETAAQLAELVTWRADLE